MLRITKTAKSATARIAGSTRRISTQIKTSFNRLSPVKKNGIKATAIVTTNFMVTSAVWLGGSHAGDQQAPNGNSQEAASIVAPPYTRPHGVPLAQATFAPAPAAHGPIAPAAPDHDAFGLFIGTYKSWAKRINPRFFLKGAEELKDALEVIAAVESSVSDPAERERNPAYLQAQALFKTMVNPSKYTKKMQELRKEKNLPDTAPLNASDRMECAKDAIVNLPARWASFLPINMFIVYTLIRSPHFGVLAAASESQRQMLYQLGNRFYNQNLDSAWSAIGDRQLKPWEMAFSSAAALLASRQAMIGLQKWLPTTAAAGSAAPQGILSWARIGHFVARTPAVRMVIPALAGVWIGHVLDNVFVRFDDMYKGLPLHERIDTKLPATKENVKKFSVNGKDEISHEAGVRAVGGTIAQRICTATFVFAFTSAVMSMVARRIVAKQALAGIGVGSAGILDRFKVPIEMGLVGASCGVAVPFTMAMFKLRGDCSVMRNKELSDGRVVPEAWFFVGS